MSFRSVTFSLAALSLAVILAGCHHTPRTGQAHPSKRAAVNLRQPLDVLIEEGTPAEMEARQHQYRLEVRNYMERELPRRLARYGFDARVIRQRSEYAGAAAGRHLLVVHYDSYNPGSSAARVVVGFGAGAASLDLSMALFQGDAPPQTWKDGCGTSAHWSRIIVKLDDNMGKKLQTFYRQR